MINNSFFKHCIHALIGLIIFIIYQSPIHAQTLSLSADKEKVCRDGNVMLTLTSSGVSSVSWQYSTDGGFNFYTFNNPDDGFFNALMDQDYCFRVIGYANGTSSYSNVVCVETLENYVPQWSQNDDPVESGIVLDFCQEVSSFSFGFFNSVTFLMDSNLFKRDFHSEWLLDDVKVSELYDMTFYDLKKSSKITHVISSNNVCPDVLFDFNIHIVESPELEISTPTPKVCVGTNTQLDITHKGALDNVQWYRASDVNTPDVLISSENTDHYTFYPSGDELYYVATTKEGCVFYSDYIRVETEEPYIPEWGRLGNRLSSGDVINICERYDNFLFDLFTPQSSFDSVAFTNTHTSKWYVDGTFVSDQFEYLIPVVDKSIKVTHVVTGDVCPENTFDFNLNVIKADPHIATPALKVCRGENAELEVKYTGTMDNIQWYRTPDANTSGTLISEGTSDRLTITPVNDQLYYAKTSMEGCEFQSDTVRIGVEDPYVPSWEKEGVPLQSGDVIDLCGSIENFRFNLFTPKVTFDSAEFVQCHTSQWLIDGNKKSDEFNFVIPLLDKDCKVTNIVKGEACPTTTFDFLFKVHPRPEVKLTASSNPICQGDELTLNLQYANTESIELYQEIDGQTEVLETQLTNRVKIVPTESASYWVVAQNKDCPGSTDTLQVDVKVAPVVINHREMYENTYELEVEGGEGTVYFQYTENDSKTTSNVLENAKPESTYHIIVSDEFGCSSTYDLETTHYVIEIPAYFYATREKWIVKNLDKFGITSVHVYDRFGKLVFMTKDPTEGWDGTYNGRNMPSTDYWYVVNVGEKDVQYTGHFTLLRER